VEFSRLKTSFRACSEACEAGGNAEAPLDFRGMKSQGKSELIADLLASQRGLTKGAGAQIPLVHRVASKSPDAADATRKMNARSGSPRVFLLLCFCRKLLLREESFAELISPECLCFRAT